ncbi:LPS assembly lipoprotein LptE [Sphingorhabdus sp. Alg239-R122]|uniref:LPS assembly lipoprotein LptE n=1 Tax=Sphingorhabdus sp. Alg239-R122 TaxID=2305989 RepID=UPI0013DB77A5|nr:LPS assembly lipoprotein LptE [Sphingorhabdus sp. Alg239-R122]
MRILLCLLLPFMLAGCGLKPLYAGGTSGAVSQSLGHVEVAPIGGQAGWLVRNALTDRLAPLSNGGPQYLLKIRLDDRLEGFGLLANDTVSRERRTLRARYQLVDAATGETVLDATAGSDAGIDVVSSEYATIAAENTALENLSREVAEQIVERLSLFARKRATPNP